jgi:hypothetical protein
MRAIGLQINHLIILEVDVLTRDSMEKFFSCHARILIQYRISFVRWKAFAPEHALLCSILMAIFAKLVLQESFHLEENLSVNQFVFLVQDMIWHHRSVGSVRLADLASISMNRHVLLVLRDSLFLYLDLLIACLADLASIALSPTLRDVLGLQQENLLQLPDQAAKTALLEGLVLHRLILRVNLVQILSRSLDQALVQFAQSLE